jgi:choline dehydrogenase
VTTGYDFIVVGAGSAGCAAAGRLATESSARVLLVEAGGSERRFTIRAPLAYGMQFGTSLDWAYESDPEPGCADRRIKQPRGRVLVGTSAMNAMVWVKGSNLDCDGWQLPGWSWKDVAPVFAAHGAGTDARHLRAMSRRVVSPVLRRRACGRYCRHR